MGISHSKDHDSTKRKSSHYKCSDVHPMLRCCQISSDIKDHHITNAQICTLMLQSREKTHSSTNFPWKTVRRKDTKFCDSAQVVVDFITKTLTKLASSYYGFHRQSSRHKVRHHHKQKNITPNSKAIHTYGIIASKKAQHLILKQHIPTASLLAEKH